MRERVAITGIGIVSALGATREATWTSMLAGACGMRPVTVFDTEGYRSRVSDHVNRRDQEFFTILDAELVALDGSGRDWDAPVLMLARRHIRLIVPASDGP